MVQFPVICPIVHVSAFHTFLGHSLLYFYFCPLFSFAQPYSTLLPNLSCLRSLGIFLPLLWIISFPGSCFSSLESICPACFYARSYPKSITGDNNNKWADERRMNRNVTDKRFINEIGEAKTFGIAWLCEHMENPVCPFWCKLHHHSLTNYNSCVLFAVPTAFTSDEMRSTSTVTPSNPHMRCSTLIQMFT